jgi:hypothetical protein
MARNAALMACTDTPSRESARAWLRSLRKLELRDKAGGGKGNDSIAVFGENEENSLALGTL